MTCRNRLRGVAEGIHKERVGSMKETQGRDGSNGRRREPASAGGAFRDAGLERFLSESNAADAGLLLVEERRSVS